MYGSPRGAGARKDPSGPVPPASASEDSDLLLLRRRHHEQPKQQMTSSGLLRYKSAPGALLGEIGDDFFGPAAESVLSDFWDNSSNSFRVAEPSPPPPPPPPPPQQQHHHQSMPTHGDLVRQSSFPTPPFHFNVEKGPRGSGGGGDGNGGGRYNLVGFSSSSWEDTLPLNDNNNNSLDQNHSSPNPPNLQNIGVQKHQDFGLTHQLSLPLTSSELAAAVDEFGREFQDAVPCRIRAKRGCATHPRSIAERVRRTRISERMRKLQELVPNMDKQTSTAEMLDLAVDYIKDLEKQVKTLKDSTFGCTCSSSKS